MTDNKSADWNWSDYFDNIHNPPMRPTVSAALEALGAGQGRQAVDLGCGSGNDTVHMLDAGFKVLAIDASEDGLQRLQDRRTTPVLQVSQSMFNQADWPQNIWTNAGFALPFCIDEIFQDVWHRIFENLEGGGVFSGQLFGLEDSWNGKVSDMNFHSADDVQKLISPHEVLLLDEETGNGKDAVGRPKYWQIFHIVLRKNPQ